MVSIAMLRNAMKLRHLVSALCNSFVYLLTRVLLYLLTRLLSHLLITSSVLTEEVDALISDQLRDKYTFNILMVTIGMVGCAGHTRAECCPNP